MELHKDMTIGSKCYRVNRLKADVGSWITFQLLTKMLPGFVSSQINLAGLPQSGASISEQDFRSIQHYCLSACYRYEDSAPGVYMPIMSNGVFAIKELEYDLPTVLGLTIHCLQFNFADFFSGDGLSVLTSLQGLNS
jgi:hypothetical protein